jgi:outer membrane protein OmpA-like peptidoglycan-associated protein
VSADPRRTADRPVSEDQGRVRTAAVLGIAIGALCLGALVLTVHSTVKAASQRLTTPSADKGKVAVAANAEEAYCTPRFKEVLERVLHSCGLSEGEARRGCKPADVKTFASISGQDFNELFAPLKQRGAVILFDTGKEDLDASAQKILDDRWLDRKGARYFFVVGRASKSGSVETNRALSHRRANSIQFHLKEKFADSELDKRVGLLWLGNEFAQLDKDFCAWQTSRTGEKCDEESINRSAFVSWVDCRL